MPGPDHNGNYEEGVRDGRLSALERRADGHDASRDNHERRLMYIERIVVGMLAIVAFTSVGPQVMGFINAMAK
jgi:hypothetical protein